MKDFFSMIICNIKIRFLSSIFQKKSSRYSTKSSLEGTLSDSVGLYRQSGLCIPNSSL